MVFGWSTAIVIKFPVFLDALFFIFLLEKHAFMGLFLFFFFFVSVPVVLSGLLASLPLNLVYLRQKK